MNLSDIDKNNIPQHVAIIMDGNGRWAKKRKLGRIFGHKKGVDAVKASVEIAGEIGVKYLTLYTFSTENWNRPANEVQALISLLVESIINETEAFHKRNVRLNVIGDIQAFPKDVVAKLNQSLQYTSKNTGLVLTLALSYSGRWEIIQAVKTLAADINSGKVLADTITDKVFEQYLTTAGIPDPELLIRTSGEERISNFLLWQLAYTEFYFPEVLWPDFKKENFLEAISIYQKRERRFGKTSEQITGK